MTNSLHLSLVVLILPFVAALICLVKGKGTGALGIFVTRVLSALFVLFGIKSLLCPSCHDVSTFTAPWIITQGISFSLELNGLAVTLITLTSLLFFFATYAKAPATNTFWSLMLVLCGCIFGVLLSTPNVVVLYIFFELMLIPLFFLLGIWGGKKRIQATMTFFLYTLAGSIPLLVTILYALSHPSSQAEGLSLTQLQNILKESGTLAPVLAATIILAALVKLPAVPFHGWLRSTYQESPTALLVVLSGIVGKIGLFLLMYFVQLFSPSEWIDAPNVSPVLATIGSLSILYGALLAWRQDTLKGIATYSSLSHIGFGVLALSSPQLMSLEGIVLLMVAHGLVIAPLFMAADFVEQTLGTQHIARLSGIADSLPRFGRIYFLLLLASVAVPLSGGFAAEFYILMSVISAYPYHAAIALIGSIMSVVYMLRAFTSIMWGAPNDLVSKSAAEDASPTHAVAAASLVLLLLIGLFPASFLKKSQSTLESIAEPATPQATSTETVLISSDGVNH